MKTKKQWIVTERSERPAGPKGSCFYCRKKIGEIHDETCVIRQRTVLVRVTIDMVMDFPEDWTPDQIEFSLNESSFCKSNIVDQIVDLQKRVSDRGRCLCMDGIMDAEYIEEANDYHEFSQSLSIERIRNQES